MTNLSPKTRPLAEPPTDAQLEEMLDQARRQYDRCADPPHDLSMRLYVGLQLGALLQLKELRHDYTGTKQSFQCPNCKHFFGPI